MEIELVSNLIKELTDLKIKEERGLELTDEEDHRWAEIENLLLNR